MIAEFESRILALIDDMVEHASDDELFASGYLRGHLTLAVAELEAGDDHSADAVHDEVTRSLEKAIHAGELSPRDQSLVLGMWDNLFQQAKKASLSPLPDWHGGDRSPNRTLASCLPFPFSNFRTHNRFGFSPASVVLSSGMRLVAHLRG